MKILLLVAFLCFTARLANANVNTSDQRIFCLLVVMEGDEEKTPTIAETWGKLCDEYTVTDGRAGDWAAGTYFGKEYSGDRYAVWLQWIAEKKKNNYDWFVLVRSNTFVVMENLLQILGNNISTFPFVFGLDMNEKKHDLETPLCGLVMSQGFLTFFADEELHQPSNDKYKLVAEKFQAKYSAPEDYKLLDLSFTADSPISSEIIRSIIPSYKKWSTCPETYVFFRGVTSDELSTLHWLSENFNLVKTMHKIIRTQTLELEKKLKSELEASLENRLNDLLKSKLDELLRLKGDGSSKK